MIACRQSEKDLQRNLSTSCLNPFCIILVTLFPILCLHTSSNGELTFFKGTSFQFLNSPEFYQVLSYTELKFILSIHLNTVLPHGRGSNITLSTNSDLLFSSSASFSISSFFVIFASYFMYFWIREKNKMEFLDYLEMNNTDSVSCPIIV